MIKPEQIQHIRVVEYLKQCTDLPYMHIANERTCSPQHGKILKRMGVIPGVADLFLPRGNGIKKGIWVEIKTNKGKASQAQRDFIKLMIIEGYEAVFAYGAEEAIALIRDFYSI